MLVRLKKIKKNIIKKILLELKIF